MDRILIIPAAGRGTRLGSDVPKVLYPVAGRPMIDRLLGLYAGVVDRFVLVLSPEFDALVRRHCETSGVHISYTIQQRPDGMLPAILTALPLVAEHRPKSVWITWCDQVAIQPATIQRMAELTQDSPDLVLPTVYHRDPYIHFDRDPRGRIIAVRHRRQGDSMPEVGESDSGFFALSRHAFLERLPAFAAQPDHGAGTGERNFLPFIPWMAERGNVITYNLVDELESLGVNTVSDAQSIEEYFRRNS